MSFFTDIDLKTIFALLSIVGIVTYHFRRKYNYWKNRNVPYLAGISNDFIFRIRRGGAKAWNENVYNAFSPHRYVGYYSLGHPVLMLRDPALIHLIFGKDFSHFTDRWGDVDEKVDPLFCNIVFLRGERWKNLRAKQTETFSSGKLKAMYFLIEKCLSVFDNHLDKALTKSLEIDVYSLCSKLSMDVIGACVFGIDVSAIEEDDSEFRRIVKKTDASMFKENVKVALRALHPKLLSWAKIKTYKPEVEDFFFSLTRDLMENRMKNEQERKDFTQLLINLRQKEQTLLQSQNYKSEPLFTETVITGSVFAFFAGGFKTVSITLAFCLYELALNPEVMEKLYQEIIRVKNTNDNKIDYNALKEMRYMDTVIYETMRLHAPSMATLRICTKPYKVPDSSFVIEKNTTLKIPIAALHLDPKHFPEPMKFDPDRFSEENKHRIIPGSYIPFGDGPRKCIGLQFAMMEMKTAIAHIIGSYVVRPSKRTEIPVTLKVDLMLNAPLHGIYVQFEKRE